MVVETKVLYTEIPEPLHVEVRKRALDLRLDLKEYVRILLEEDLRKPLAKSAAAIEGEWKGE